MSIHPKVVASTAAGAIVTIAVFIAASFGVEIPAEVALAAATLISGAAGWFRSSGKELNGS